MQQQILWTKYLIPWLTLGLITSYLFYLSRNYIWVVVLVVITGVIARRTNWPGRVPCDYGVCVY